LFFGIGIGISEALLIFVLGIIPMAWVYKDAQKRGMSGIAWIAAMIFTNLLGAFFIYLAVRGKFPESD